MENKKRSRLGGFLLAVAMIFFSGCSHQPAKPEDSYRVVTNVQILYRNGPTEAQMSFSEEKNVQAILEYLRQISPYGTPAEDPNSVDGSHFYITLIHSDGSTNTYHQLADRMMQLDGGPWRRIDVNRAGKLEILLKQMAEDNPISGTAPAPPLLRPELRG